MINKGILNPQINSLLARVRHQNMLIIADRGFTNFPGVEIIDISLVDNVPTVLQVFNAIKENFDIGEIFMAKEFLDENTKETQDLYKTACGNSPVTFEASDEMKKRAPKAIGIIRTADTIQYGNIMVVSGRIDKP